MILYLHEKTNALFLITLTLSGIELIQLIEFHFELFWSMMSQVVIGSSFAQIHTMEVLNYMDCKSWIDESNRNQKRWEVPDSIGNNFHSSWDGHPAKNELCLRYLMRFLWFLGFLSLAIQPEIINHSQNE